MLNELFLTVEVFSIVVLLEIYRGQKECYLGELQ